MAGDAFFWPTMSLSSVMSKTDGKNSKILAIATFFFDMLIFSITLVPHIAQSYIVPVPSSCASQISNNDSATFSMWEHFLDFCKTDPLSVVVKPRKVPACNSYVPVNYYTGKKRLNTMMRLAQGMHA